MATATDPSKARSRRRWPVRALAVALGALAALGVLEVGLRAARLAWPPLHRLLYSPAIRTEYDGVDTTAGLLARGPFGYQPLGTNAPGFVLSSRGFRTREYRVARRPGVLRLVALGDSFTFDSHGVPFDRMWHQVLRRELATAIERPVEAISLSQPGVGPRFELRLWELEGRRLAPDLVILGFFVGNDFHDETGRPLERSLAAGMAHYSVTYRLVRNALRLRRARAGAPPAAGPPAGPPAARRGGYEDPGYAATYDPDRPTLDRETWLGYEAGRMGPLTSPDLLRFEGLFAATAAVLERLVRDVESHGARCVVLLIPDEAQVDPAVRAQVEAELGYALDLDRPQRRLAALFAEHDIDHLDLLPAFRRAHRAGGPRLYRPRDTHWTAAGNALAGRALARYLLAEGLVPPAPG